MTHSRGANNDWSGKIAMITGASSGIGAATALKMSAQGLKVALVARRRDRLEELQARITAAGGTALVVTTDLAQPDERLRALEEVRAGLGEPDVLLNGAGFGWYGCLDAQPAADGRQMIAVNVDATYHLTRLVLPAMIARGSGLIINISSIAARLPIQGIAVYSASKAFVDAFSVALGRELKGSGVRVAVVRPGPVRSEFFTRAATQTGGLPIPGERLSVSTDVAAARIADLLNNRRARISVPGIMSVVTWIEPCFGWLFDLVGPVLLKRGNSATKQ